MSDSFILGGRCAEVGGTGKMNYPEKGYHINIFLKDKDENENWKK